MTVVEDEADEDVGGLPIVEIDGDEHQTGAEENLQLKALEGPEAVSEKEVEVYHTDLCDPYGNFLQHRDMPGGSQDSPDSGRDHLRLSVTDSENMGNDVKKVQT